MEQAVLNAALQWYFNGDGGTGEVWDYVVGLYENESTAKRKSMYLDVLFSV